VGRVGVKHGAACVFVEDAHARHLVAVDFLLFVIVLSVGTEFLLTEGHTVVEVEIAAERRHPGKAPAHALPEGLDLDEWRPRDHNKRHVAIGEMNGLTISGEPGAARATLLPSMGKHAVTDDYPA